MKEKTLNIAMVGPSGVGKTSLLAAMYNELYSELLDIKCKMKLEAGPTSKFINERLRELKQLGSSRIIPAGAGIQGTSEKREFVFPIAVENKIESDLILKFIDIPGGWYTGDGDYATADKIVEEAHISFLVVDSVALMQYPDKNTGLGKYHDYFNKPGDIFALYDRALSGKSRHIIVITLVRAETYVKDGKKDELIEKAKKAYSELATSNKENATIILCYVETVGCLKFHKFIVDENGQVVSAEFRKCDQFAKEYSPSGCAKPLRLSLHEGFVKVRNKAIDEAEKADSGIDWLLDLFGFTTEKLKKARQNADTLIDVYNKLTENLDLEGDYEFIETP